MPARVSSRVENEAAKLLRRFAFCCGLLVFPTWTKHCVLPNLPA